MGEGDPPSGVIVIFLFFLFLIAVNSCVHSCPGLIKGLGLANVIIGVLISLTAFWLCQLSRVSPLSFSGEAYRAFSFSSLSQLVFSLGGLFVCGGAVVMRARSTRRQWQTRCGLMRR